MDTSPRSIGAQQRLRQLADLDALAWAEKPVRLIDLVPVLATTETPGAIRARIGAGRRFRDMPAG